MLDAVLGHYQLFVVQQLCHFRAVMTNTTWEYSQSPPYSPHSSIPPAFNHSLPFHLLPSISHPPMGFSSFLSLSKKFKLCPVNLREKKGTREKVGGRARQRWKERKTKYWNRPMRRGSHKGQPVWDYVLTSQTFLTQPCRLPLMHKHSFHVVMWSKWLNSVLSL